MTQSAVYGEVWAHLRDRARPVHERDVAELRFQQSDDFQAPSRAHKRRLLKRRSEISPPRPEPVREATIMHDAFNVRADFRRKRLALRVEAKPPVREIKALIEKTPILLLTDQRSDRAKRFSKRVPYGPAVPAHHSRFLASVNASMAVQFGPWPLRIHNLAYEVTHVSNLVD